MRDSFDIRQYLTFLGTRLRFLAVVCGSALAVSLAISLLLPKKYTATSRVIVEPAAGADVRSAMVISPIYLESLTTYEHFTSSDSLFLTAANRFHLRKLFGRRPIESLKRDVLEVEMPRNTKILEIKATLPDARLAQALALYLARQTVELSRSANEESDRELLSSAEKQWSEARARRDKAEADWSRSVGHELPEDLRAALGSDMQLRSHIQAQLLATQVDLAEGERGDSRSEPNLAAVWVRDAPSRARALQKQLTDLDARIEREQALLADRETKLSLLDSERKQAQAVLAAAETSLGEARASAGYRGERLRIIDPGIVPERPSSPNLPLNVIAAVFLGVLLSMAITSVEFLLRQQPAVEVLPMRSKAREAGD
jgi:uncharacterized protein involved in exopolysaccharide biosynthesis